MIEEGGVGQTPLTEEQRVGLLLPLTDQVELNAAEARAIAQARTWALVRSRPLSSSQVLREEWLKQLHKKMFNSVWVWAGIYRRSDVNIGNVAWPQVPTAIREALGDATFLIDHRIDSGMTMVEVAVRIHHKLVVVHPFPNGNGRWSRLVADILMRANGARPLSWGAGADLQGGSDTRSQYLASLREADNGDFRQLIAFAQSSSRRTQV